MRTHPANTGPPDLTCVVAETTPGGPVLVAVTDDVVTISLHGRLDGGVGHLILKALWSAIERGAARVDLDLLAVRSWTEAGAAVLARCRTLAAGRPVGLRFRTTAGPGHDALLFAFT
ncbi:MAG: hypothetical protein H0V33_04360 [Acidimicrobiia bacterium]|jgi:anti-anti-sigma regulatory factor|nr:hypothetical protein [Acidimicrobiia bacterium]